MDYYDNKQPKINNKQPAGRSNAMVLYSNVCGITAFVSLFGMVISPVTILFAEAAIVFSFLAKNDPAVGRHATLGLILGIITMVFIAVEYLILIQLNLALQDPAVAHEFYSLMEKFMEQYGLNQMP